MDPRNESAYFCTGDSVRTHQVCNPIQKLTECCMSARLCFVMLVQNCPHTLRHLDRTCCRGHSSSTSSIKAAEKHGEAGDDSDVFVPQV